MFKDLGDNIFDMLDLENIIKMESIYQSDIESEGKIIKAEDRLIFELYHQHYLSCKFMIKLLKKQIKKNL